MIVKFEKGLMLKVSFEAVITNIECFRYHAEVLV